MILTAHNLNYRYRGNKKDTLHDVSLELRKGEICGIVGTNGAGKTTLISLLATILPLGEGTLTIDGITADKRNLHRMEMCKRISMIPQNPAIYERLTGRENLRYFARLHGMDERGGRLSKRVDELLEAVGLHHKGDELAGTYSGGMKRRLNLAAGLVHGPKILFLDEPAVGIDARSRHLIMTLLRELKKEMTLLYASHYLEEVEQLCDRVLLLEGGTIVNQTKKRRSGFYLGKRYRSLFGTDKKETKKKGGNS